MSEIDKQEICPIPALSSPTVLPTNPIAKKTKKKLVKNEVCGNIKQTCNDKFVAYWRSFRIIPLPSGSVTVLNMSHCVMTVRADLDGDGYSEAILFTLTEKDQSKSITLTSIANLEVCCEGVATNQICSGKFTIELHYEKDCLLVEEADYC